MQKIFAAFLLLFTFGPTTAQDHHVYLFPGHRPQQDEKDISGKWVGIVCIKKPSPVVLRLEIAPKRPNRLMSVDITEGIAKFPSDGNPRILVWKTYPLNIHVTSRILEDSEQGWTLQGSSQWMELDPRNEGNKAVIGFWYPSSDLQGVPQVNGVLDAFNGKYYDVRFSRDRGDPLETVAGKKLEVLVSGCINWR